MLTDFVGVSPLLLPLTLGWLGLAVSAALGVLGVLLFKVRLSRIKGVFYVVAAVLAILFYVWMLFGSEDGVICCRPVWQTALLYGWVLLPLLCFLWDGARLLLSKRKKP